MPFIMLRQKRHKPVTISFIAGILQPNRRDNRGPQREDPFELNTTRRAPPKNYSVEERIQSEEELALTYRRFSIACFGGANRFASITGYSR